MPEHMGERLPTAARAPLFSPGALRRLLLPLIIEQLLAVTIGLADTIMVASVGEAAVSAISLVDSINILLIQVFSALATGGAVVASQYIGRGEHDNACKAAKQLTYAIFGMASVIMVLALVFRRGILYGVFGGIEPAVMQNAEVYLVLSAASYPFLALYNGGAALFRSMGNSKVSLQISVLMNIINLVGNAMLIYGFGWGVAGAAFSSLVSRALGGVIITALVCRKGLAIHINRIWRPERNGHMVRAILKVGLPNGAENGMFQIGKLMVARLIASFGTAAIAANAIANTIGSFSYVVGMAIGLCMITVVGQCVGARDYEQAIFYTRKLMKTTYLASGAVNLAIILFTPMLVGLFQFSVEAMAEAEKVLYLSSSCAIFIWPMAFALPNALRAAGDAKFTMVVSMLSMWIFRIGMSYVFGAWMGMGVFGVWLAMMIDWVARALAFALRFVRGKWKQARVI